MVLGRIVPPYESIVLGLSEKTVQSAIFLAGRIPKDKVEEKTRDLGDIGEVAVKMVKNTENPFKDYSDYIGELSVKDIFDGLRKIASTGGKGSHEIKKKIQASMLIEADEVVRKYIARISEGTMRIGVGDMTILNALSVFRIKTKKGRT